MDQNMESNENRSIVQRTGNANAAMAEDAAGGREAAAGSQPQQGQQQEQQQGLSFYSIVKSLVIRAAIIYFITSFFRRPQPAMEAGPDSQGGSASVLAHVPAQNTYDDGRLMDLYAYINEFESIKPFPKPSELVWFKEDLKYGDWSSGDAEDGTYVKATALHASENLRNNGSVFLHIFIVKSGFSPDPEAGKGRYEKWTTVHFSHRLNKYKKRKFQKTSNLITGETIQSEEDIKKAEKMKEEIVSHWHPNVTINLVHDFTRWTRGSVPAPLDEFVEFSPKGDRYKPILFINTYWNLMKDYRPINTSTDVLNLTLTFQPLTLFKWQLYAAQSMKNKWPGAGMLESLQGEAEDEEQDALKEAFLETSLYLLVLTGAVSILHSVFEFLAFKNDIQFWNNRQSLEGLSVRSVFFNVFQSVIVLLYVMDNETNFVIKVSIFIGLCIELWKITKVMDVSLNRERRILGIPTLSLKDKGTYIQSNTKQYDQMAFRYLGVALFPLLGGYCAYSLIYLEHKGWYSFVLSMLYGFLLTFGFIMMTPQLFINYKLKSVAHLPWRMLTYKALNTFIDDIFAFVIRMPTMYRLGCLRDDVIFFIFLYQRYIYRVDPSRLNEFGFSQDMLQESQSKDPQATTPAANGEIKSAEEKKKD